MTNQSMLAMGLMASAAIALVLSSQRQGLPAKNARQPDAMQPAASDEATDPVAESQLPGHSLRLSIHDILIAVRHLLVRELRKHRLSAQEQDIALLVLKGRSNASIASDMCLSVSAIKYHVRNIYEKTGASSREDLFCIVGAGIDASKDSWINASDLNCE